MELVKDNTSYIPVYHSNTDCPELEYEELMAMYRKSLYVSKDSFQSLYDALMIQILYWDQALEIEEEIVNNKQDYDNLIFEIKSLHFYRFFYDDCEWYPYKLVDYYGGDWLCNPTTRNAKYNIGEQSIEFIIEDNWWRLRLSKEEFIQVFKLKDDSEISSTISAMCKARQIEIGSSLYFFLTKENLKTVTLYLKEQVELLNNIYESLKLPKIEMF